MVQLLIFIQIVFEDFVINKELLALEPLHNTTKGQDVCDTVMKVIKGIDNINLSVIVTDGMKSMHCTQVGLVGLLMKAGINCTALYIRKF